MCAYFTLPAAGAGFFLSSFFLMLFEHATAGSLGIRQIDYVTSMVVTIGLWLVIAPAAGAIANARQDRHKRGRDQ